MGRKESNKTRLYFVSIIDESELSTPKRKRGRPPRNSIGPNHSVVCDDGDDDDDLNGDSSDDSEEVMKKQKLSDTDNDVLDKNYSPLKDVVLSSRRIQPRRSLKGKHSKYGDDFVLDKKMQKFHVKVELDIDTEIDAAGNTSSNKVEEKDSQLSKDGRKGRHKKSLANQERADSKYSSSNITVEDTDLNVKKSIKTYERKSAFSENSSAVNREIILEQHASGDLKVDNFKNEPTDVLEKCDQEHNLGKQDDFLFIKNETENGHVYVVKANDINTDRISKESIDRVNEKSADIAFKKSPEKVNEQSADRIFEENAGRINEESADNINEERADRVHEEHNERVNKENTERENNESADREAVKSADREGVESADREAVESADGGAVESADQALIINPLSPSVVGDIEEGISDAEDIIDTILDIDEDSVKGELCIISNDNTANNDGLVETGSAGKEQTTELVAELLNESDETKSRLQEDMSGEIDLEEEGESNYVEVSLMDEKVKTNNVKESNRKIINDQIVVVNGKHGTIYKCKICDKAFTKMSYLKLHIPKHTDRFKCDKCLKTFTRNDSLQKHNCGVVRMLLERPLEEIERLFEKDGKQVHECLTCSKTFESQIEVVNHYMTHLNESITCLKCNLVLEKGQSLADHNCQADERLDFPCDICGQAFKNAQYLHRHLVIHTDLFKCKKCNFCFSRKDSLHKHVLKCCPELADSYKILYCDLCFRVFSTKSGRMNHAAKCKWVKCDSCAKVFSSNTDMETHECFKEDKAGVEVGVEFSCGKCDKTFLNNYYLSQHQAIHEETYQCDVCKKNLKTQDELTSHNNICKLVQKIRSTGQAACDLCRQVFNKPKLMRLHYHTHTHPYECMKCQKRFLKSSGLTGHACKVIEGAFKCQACDRSFTSKRFLIRHKSFFHSKQVYHCQFCGKGFNRRLKFQNHICKLEDGSYGNIVMKNGKRAVVEKLVCDTCGKTFSSRSNLNKHVISHGEKQFNCKFCGKTFHYENYLHDHISGVHLNLYKYQCTDCGKMMKSKTGLVAHVKQFHRENADVFTCEMCGKSFKQKGNLHTHMYSHKTERNFVCEFCQKSFKYPDQLSRHKLLHTMQNKLQCSFCEKKFVKDYELKRHEMVFHSGLVYVCGLCFARCGHKHTLIRHYKRKHPGKADELNEPGVLDGLLKRIQELPDYQGGVEVVEPQLIENIDLIQFDPIMPPQDAAEVLHSLSTGAASIEPPSENKKSELGSTILPAVSSDTAGTIVEPSSQDGNKTVHIQFESTEVHKAEVIQQAIQLPLEQVVSTDVNQLQLEVSTAQSGEAVPSQEAKVEETITMNNGAININGQCIPIANLQAIPQTIDLGNAGEGQIVILQIWDPQGEEQGAQEQFIQIQGDPLIVENSVSLG